MKKWKTSLYGYDKKAVRDMMKRLQTEYDTRKKSLESEYDQIQEDIKELQERIRSLQEGGREQ